MRESDTRTVVVSNSEQSSAVPSGVAGDSFGGTRGANTAVSRDGPVTATKQSRSHLLKNHWRIAFGTSVIFAAMGCGNTGVGAMDAGRDVMGDVVEYGVNYRPANNRYCAQIEASATPVYAGSDFIALCKPDAPAGTRCPGFLTECLPIQRYSPDLERYAAANRVPQLCTESVGFLAIERCDIASPRGCTDGTFCALIRHRITEEVMPVCVPYPCNP